SARRAPVEQVEQRAAGRDQHLVLELVAVVEVEEPPAAAVGAAAAEPARAAEPAAATARTARPAARRRSAGGKDHDRATRPALPGALPLRAALAGRRRAAELRPQLVDPRRIDLAVGPLEPLEHLRR